MKVFFFLIPYFILYNSLLLIGWRHTIRKGHFPFFQQHRAERSKSNSYRHYLFLYISIFDPLLMMDAQSRGFSFFDYVKGFLVWLVVLSFIIPLGLITFPKA